MTEGYCVICGWDAAAEEETDAPCVVCGKPTSSGDEPGHGHYDNDVAAPLCSVACTDAFYTDDPEDEETN